MRTVARILLALLGAATASPVPAFPWYAQGEGIWGAELMSAEERSRYVQALQGMRRYDECQAYVAAHRAEIQARARARQVRLPPPPATSPCEVMQRMGRFSGNAPACPLEKEKPACPADKPRASSGPQFF